MDIFKRELNKCGLGGIKCWCCRPVKKGKKDRTWTRKARRILKQKDLNLDQHKEKQNVS